MKRSRFLFAVLAAVVFVSVMAAGCSGIVSKEAQEYDAEMESVNVKFSPHSVTVIQDSGGDWPFLRPKPRIGGETEEPYGKFEEPVVFTSKNVAGMVNDRDMRNLWIAIKTDTLSAEQRAAMPDFGGDKLVYISILYVEITMSRCEKF